MITAEQVRDAMRERGLSQGKLSELAKVSKPVISTWLNGVREPSDISKTRIAFALDLLEPGDADDSRLIFEGAVDRASFVERHGDTVRVGQKDGQVVVERIHKKQIRM